MKQPIELHEVSTSQKSKEIPYENLVQTEEFKNLIKKKKAFIVPTTIFFLIFYFTLPLLAAYTKVLHTEVIGPITGAWIFAILQFIVVWACGFIYVKKSEKYDKMASSLLKKYRKELNQ